MMKTYKIIGSIGWALSLALISQNFAQASEPFPCCPDPGYSNSCAADCNGATQPSTVACIRASGGNPRIQASCFAPDAKNCTPVLLCPTGTPNPVTTETPVQIPISGSGTVYETPTPDPRVSPTPTPDPSPTGTPDLTDSGVKFPVPNPTVSRADLSPTPIATETPADWGTAPTPIPTIAQSRSPTPSPSVGPSGSATPDPSLAAVSNAGKASTIRNWSDGTTGSELITDPASGKQICPNGVNLPDDLSVCINPRDAVFSHCVPSSNLLPRHVEDFTTQDELLIFSVLDPSGYDRWLMYYQGRASGRSGSPSKGAVAIPMGASTNSAYSAADAAAYRNGSSSSVTQQNAQCAGPMIGVLNGDTNDVVGAQYSLNGYSKSIYGPVYFANDGVSNPWLGTTPKQAACPMVNEVVVQKVFTVASESFSVAQCIPAIAVKDRVLYKGVFDKNLHAGRIIEATARPPNTISLGEPTYSSGANAGKVIDSTLLQASNAERGNLVPFHRGIWGCRFGMKLNVQDGKCYWNADENACDAGDGSTGTVLPSAVGASYSSVPSAEDLKNLFNARVNKKLSCCTNDFTPGVDNMKFDCLETKPELASDFNALWSSTDPDGNFNALYLSGPNKNPLTGFYTLEGSRCSEFSDFTKDTLQRGSINKAGVFTAKGAPLAKPVGSSSVGHGTASFDVTATSLGNLHAPSTVAERIRCPILVRAAMVASCPQYPSEAAAVGSAVKKTYEEKAGAGGTVSNRHCSSASDIQIHIKVEQYTEREGVASIKPLDTVIQSPTTGTVSVSDIITQKYGTACPIAGMTYNAALKSCVY